MRQTVDANEYVSVADSMRKYAIGILTYSA